MAAARAIDCVSTSLSDKAKSYANLLNHVDGSKPKFTWLGSKEELGRFIAVMFEKSTKDESSATEATWSEDAAHNMVSWLSSQNVPKPKRPQVKTSPTKVKTSPVENVPKSKRPQP